MVNRRKKHKESTYSTASINKIIIIIVTGSILFQGAIWLIDSVYVLQKDIDEVAQIQTEHIQTELKERVASVIDYSDYKSKQIEAVLRSELKSRTYEAHSLMSSIYERNKESKSKEEISEIIKDALREIRFNDGRGYFFIDNLEGDVILYPVYPENEGTNLMDLQDEKGHYSIREEIQLVQTQKEGYIEGYWKNPRENDDEAYKKITFVKEFEPYGWYVGCGDYVDEITKEIQKEVLDYVESIQYGEDKNRYVFLHDYNGIELANGVYPQLVGVNNYDLEDSFGSKVYQDQITVCKENGGGYLTHYWPMSEGEGQYKKMTYVAPLEKWEWVIGTGVDVSAIDEQIRMKQAQLKTFIWQRVLIIFLVLSILVMISALRVKHFTSKVKRNFSVFRDYMISAEKDLKAIDIEHLDYTDFSELAEVTNSMTARINHLLHYDELTGLYNRRFLKDIMDSAFMDSPKNFGIILLDIDFFKHINDNFGHEVGDEVLRLIAKVIANRIPKNGKAIRFGGEEFAVVLSNVSFDDLIGIAEDVRRAVANFHIELIEGHVTVSCGVAHIKDWDREQLFKQADTKLYLAKESGRNRIEY
jgi:diguanylate cyclase (GGDEF)-like protein